TREPPLMRLYRFLPLLLTGAGVVLLTGALRGPSHQPEPPPQRITPPGLAEAVPDRAAPQLLNRAVEHLRPGLVSWLQAEGWLRCRFPGLEYEGEGRYVLAPGQRFRLELRTRRKDHPRRAPTTVLSVSDGRDLWQASRTARGWGDVERLRVGH